MEKLILFLELKQVGKSGNKFILFTNEKLSDWSRLKAFVDEQEGHDGPVSLHWLIREIHSY